MYRKLVCRFKKGYRRISNDSRRPTLRASVPLLKSCERKALREEQTRTRAACSSVSSKLPVPIVDINSSSRTKSLQNSAIDEFAWTELLQSHEYKNWLKVSLALRLLCDYVSPLIDQIVTEFHGNLIERYGKASLSHSDILEYSGASPIRSWMREIMEVQRIPVPPKEILRVCDVRKWPTDDGAWEIAKAYMTRGFKSGNGSRHAEAFDTTALLNFMSRCKLADEYLSDHRKSQRVLEVRNKTMHCPRLEFTDQQREENFRAILNFVEDERMIDNRLVTSQDAHNVIACLKEIKDADISIDAAANSTLLLVDEETQQEPPLPSTSSRNCVLKNFQEAIKKALSLSSATSSTTRLSNGQTSENTSSDIGKVMKIYHAEMDKKLAGVWNSITFLGNRLEYHMLERITRSNSKQGKTTDDTSTSQAAAQRSKSDSTMLSRSKFDLASRPSATTCGSDPARVELAQCRGRKRHHAGVASSSTAGCADEPDDEDGQLRGKKRKKDDKNSDKSSSDHLPALFFLDFSKIRKMKGGGGHGSSNFYQLKLQMYLQSQTDNHGATFVHTLRNRLFHATVKFKSSFAVISGEPRSSKDEAMNEAAVQALKWLGVYKRGTKNPRTIFDAYCLQQINKEPKYRCYQSSNLLYVALVQVFNRNSMQYADVAGENSDKLFLQTTVSSTSSTKEETERDAAKTSLNEACKNTTVLSDFKRALSNHCLSQDATIPLFETTSSKKNDDEQEHSTTVVSLRRKVLRDSDDGGMLPDEQPSMGKVNEEHATDDYCYTTPYADILEATSVQPQRTRLLAEESAAEALLKKIHGDMDDDLSEQLPSVRNPTYKQKLQEYSDDWDWPVAYHTVEMSAKFDNVAPMYDCVVSSKCLRGVHERFVVNSDENGFPTANEARESAARNALVRLGVENSV